MFYSHSLGLTPTPSCPIVDHLFYSFPPILSQFSVLLLTRRAPPLRATSTATPVLTLTLPYTYLVYSLFPNSRHYIYCLTLIPALLCLLLDYLSYSFTSTLSEFVSHSSPPPPLLLRLALLLRFYRYLCSYLAPTRMVFLVLSQSLPLLLFLLPYLDAYSLKERKRRVGGRVGVRE